MLANYWTLKVDVNKCDNDDRSPLYAACQGGYTDIVEVLLENNADINLFTFDGDSPLSISCSAGHSNIVEMLLKGVLTSLNAFRMRHKNLLNRYG